MTTPAAIIAGSIIIALSVAFSLRWEIVTSTEGTLQLDRWTGTVKTCFPQARSPAADQLEIKQVCGLVVLKK